MFHMFHSYKKINWKHDEAVQTLYPMTGHFVYIHTLV